MAMITQNIWATSIGRMRTIVGGMDFILGKKEEEQKELKDSSELGKAHALCAATDKGKKRLL